MVLINCRFIVVGVSRDTMLHFKEIVGVAVNIGLWGCCQSNQHRIKIFKDGTVLFKDAAMTLVNNDQVKMNRRKQPLSFCRLGIVDGIKDGRIGRKDDAGVAIVLIGAKIAQRHFGQVVLESVLCLLDQCGAVGKKKDVGHPLAAAEHID